MWPDHGAFGKMTIVVTSTHGSGPASLSQPVLHAQAIEMVTFGPMVFPPAAPNPNSVAGAYLRDTTVDDLTIDGSATSIGLSSGILVGVLQGLNILSSNYVVRNRRSAGFSVHGIKVYGTSNNVVEGNAIGNNG